MSFPNKYYQTIDLKLLNNKSYDFYLSSDSQLYKPLDDNNIYDTDLVINFDFNNSACVSGNTIYSLNTWTGSSVSYSGLSLSNAGLTGLDTGLISWKNTLGDLENTQLVSALTQSTYIIPSGDTRFFATQISGFTMGVEYPVLIVTDVSMSGTVSQLEGGWYNGFFKLDGYDYQTLDTRNAEGFTMEFILKKDDTVTSGNTGTNINQYFNNANKGYFCFIGTRAENKFSHIFSGSSSGDSWSACTSGCSQFCTIPKESGSTTSTGLPLDPPKLFIENVQNQFLIYRRGENQKTVCNYDGSGITTSSTTIYETANQFLIYNRADSGTTVCDYSGRGEIDVLDYKSDIVDNTIGFRITDNGELSVKYLTYSCDTSTTITEVSTTGVTSVTYISPPNIFPSNTWNYLTIRYVPYINLDNCENTWKAQRKGKLMFYINGYLKYTIHDFPELICRSLDEFPDKQLFVPYNLSVGGGSIGLFDSITFDGKNPYNEGLPIEQNFAGSFIGKIAKFRMYNNKLDFNIVKHNFDIENRNLNYIFINP